MNFDPMTPAELKAQSDRSKKLLLIVAMVSMIMIFAGFTSAYIVAKNSREDWLKDLQLPSSFFYSTIAIVISSITIHLAKKSIKKDDKKTTSLYLLITLLLGILFAYLQTQGFQQLYAMKLFPVGGTGAITISFLYIFVYVHLAHLFGGLIALFVINYNQYNNKYSSKEYLGIELGAMYWHFLDALWLYLFFFLLYFK